MYEIVIRRFLILCRALSYLQGPQGFFLFFFFLLTALNRWVLTRIYKWGFILSWSSCSIMNPVYETDLRSLECRQILNSLEVPYVILVFLEKSLLIIHQSNYKITRDNKLRQFQF